MANRETLVDVRPVHVPPDADKFTGKTRAEHWRIEGLYCTARRQEWRLLTQAGCPEAATRALARYRAKIQRQQGQAQG